MQWAELLEAIEFAESRAVLFNGKAMILAFNKATVTLSGPDVETPRGMGTHMRTSLAVVPVQIIAMGMKERDFRSLKIWVKNRQQVGDKLIKYISTSGINRSTVFDLHAFDKLFWEIAENICKQYDGSYQGASCSAVTVHDPPCSVQNVNIHFLFDMSMKIRVGIAKIIQ